MCLYHCCHLSTIEHLNPANQEAPEPFFDLYLQTDQDNCSYRLHKY